nr:helix-turn-helix domain-containing protein [Puniceibacterium sediminis]
MPRGQAISACPNPGTGPRLLDRWELLSLVTGLRHELGLTDRDVMVLRAHLTVLPHGPLDPSKLNVSFMQIAEILERACGMDERRFRRGETRLEQVGLIRRRLSGNGRRFPERDNQGLIVNAYGVDIAPLFERYAELLDMRDRIEEERLLLRSRKNSVSARLQAALKTFLQSSPKLPDWIESLRIQLRCAVRRKTTALDELDAIEARIAQFEAEISRADSDQQQDQTAMKTAVLADTCPVDAGQTVRHIESKLKEKNKKEHIRFDPRLIVESWRKTEMLQQFYPNAPEREREAAEALFSFSSFIGLGQSGVIHGLSVIGWEAMIHTLDYLSSKIATISRPEGYLRSMINAYEQGEPIAGGRVVPNERCRWVQSYGVPT